MPVSLWVVYANVTLYALCYQMQSPVQPHLVKSLGACPLTAAAAGANFRAFRGKARRWRTPRSACSAAHTLYSCTNASLRRG